MILCVKRVTKCLVHNRCLLLLLLLYLHTHIHTMLSDWGHLWM